jgi:hypothetical protein
MDNRLLPDLPAGVKFPSAYFGICTDDAATKHCEHASRAGGLSHAHVFVEAVAKTITALSDPVRLRAELQQVAGVCTTWIQQIDQRGAPAQAVPHV